MNQAGHVTIRTNRQDWLVRTNRYQARIVAGAEPAVHVYREGWRLMRLPAVSALASVDAAESLTDIRIEPPAETGKGNPADADSHEFALGRATVCLGVPR